MLVVLIGGPIASGKSSLSRAVAVRLEEIGATAVAVLDLDVVYEMLDPRGRSGRPKSDELLWSQARRTAGRLAAMFVAEDRCVVAEGNFAAEHALREFEAELPAGVLLRLVMLNIDFEVAVGRAQADPTRGLSKDPSFLALHHREFAPEWHGRDVLELDTGALSRAEAAEAVVAWLGRARSRRAGGEIGL
jgi:shikimate kinase